MSKTIVLPPRLDLTSVGALTAALAAEAGGPLTLDASQVEAVGGLGLQALLAARADWSRAGQRLAVTPRSEAFDKALTQFGVAADQIECGA